MIIITLQSAPLYSNVSFLSHLLPSTNTWSNASESMNKMLSFPWPTLLQVQVSTSRTSLDPMPRAPPQSARRCIHVLVHVWKAQDSIHRLIRTRCFRECIQNWGSHKHFRFTKMKFTCELCKHNFRIIIKVVMFFLLIIVSHCSKQMTSCIIVHRMQCMVKSHTE